jgi:hypothetical protein
MIIEELLLLALAVIYAAISYGHSPPESRDAWDREKP